MHSKRNNQENEKQCNYLVKQYEKETNTKNKNKKLQQETSENKILENKITKKQEILKDLNQQLERRKLLEQQLAECDRQFLDLIEKYKSLDSKERGNSYGKK